MLRSSIAARLVSGTVLFGALAGPQAFAETPADTLVIANGIDDLKSFDPAESFEFSGQDQINNIYETLVEIDPKTLKPIPGLAASWSVADDGVTYTFKMVEGRKFASGNPITAEDAAFSLQRVVKLDLTPAFIFTQFGLTKDNVDTNVKAVDASTLQIVTDKPYAPSFLYNALTAEVGSIVDKAVVSENAGDDMGNTWLDTHSAGSGAYTLRGWKPNESVILEANPNFEHEVAMKRVFIRHVVEPATQLLLLQRGDVDIARNLGPTDIAAVEKDDNLKIQTELRGQVYYLSGNQKDETLAKPGVMEAIRYLVDYDGITSTLLKGQEQTHQSFLPAGFLGAVDDKPYKLDVARAKELLAQAGYPDGFETELMIRNEKERVDIAQAIQGTLAQAGIKASIRSVTGSEALSIYRARNHKLTLQTWGPDYPDPQTNASVFAANADNSDAAQLTGNLAWRNAYDAKQTTQMVADAVVERDEEKRAKLYEEMQRLDMKVSPLAVLFQRSEQPSMKKGVEGFSTGGAVASAFYWPVTKTAQ